MYQGVSLPIIGYRKNGRPIRPIMGAEDGGDAGDAAAEALLAAAVADAAGSTETAPVGDQGFPANTPWQDMTPGQQVNYWKFQARKHENTAKSRADYDDLKAKAARADALDRELMSDAEKKVAAATDAANAAASEKYAPLLVKAEFRAAAAGRLDADKIDTVLAPLNMAHFLTTTGEVDTDKVTAFVDSIAPATGNGNNGTTKLGPSSHGLGQRQPGAAKATVASGAELYASRHPAK